jgi:hypothetical protein
LQIAIEDQFGPGINRLARSGGFADKRGEGSSNSVVMQAVEEAPYIAFRHPEAALGILPEKRVNVFNRVVMALAGAISWLSKCV